MEPNPRLQPSARNLLIVCAAAAFGLIVGGFSVLGVALAVIEPPSHDAPAGSAVFDGRAHVVQQAPVASSMAPRARALRAPEFTAAVPAPSAPASSNVTSNGRPQTMPTQPDNDKTNLVAANPGPSQYDSWNNFFGYSRNDNWRN